MGCDKPIPKGMRFSVAGISIDRCPNYYLKDSGEFTSEAFEMHNWREKGILPRAGGWTDQPNKFVEICNFLDFLFGYKQRHESRKR